MRVVVEAEWVYGVLAYDIDVEGAISQYRGYVVELVGF